MRAPSLIHDRMSIREYSLYGYKDVPTLSFESSKKKRYLGSMYEPRGKQSKRNK